MNKIRLSSKCEVRSDSLGLRRKYLRSSVRFDTSTQANMKFKKKNCGRKRIRNNTEKLLRGYIWANIEFPQKQMLRKQFEVK